MMLHMNGNVLLVVLLLAKYSNESSTTPQLENRTAIDTRPLSILLVTAPFVGHLTPFLAFAEELVQRGHNVTLVSSPTEFIEREVGKYGVSFWSIGDGFLRVQKNNNIRVENPSGKNRTYITGLKALNMSFTFQRLVLKAIDNHAIKSFDAIVADSNFFNFLVCFSRKWNITGIFLSSTLLTNPLNLHAWSFPLSVSGYTENLTFLQRLVTLVRKNSLHFIVKLLVSTYFFREDICTDVGLSSEIVFHFENYNPIIITSSIGFEFPHALLPFTHYVGPLISPSQPQLPQDIVDWLDERGPRSVVYVSMGTTAILTSAQAEMIINGATQANFSVVWSLRKTNQYILEHMTFDRKKVMIKSWIPQVTILGHPSIQSAVLHGGPGGIQEALTCGVPMLVIPFLFDQLDNAVRVQYYHYGEMIHLHEMTTSLVSHKLRIVGSDLYRKKLLTVQKIFKKDRGTSKAADLVEFYSNVGYDHLVPSYVKYNWTWVQFHNVDVYFVLLTVPLILSYFVYQSLCRCCFKVRMKTKNKKE